MRESGTLIQKLFSKFYAGLWRRCVGGCESARYAAHQPLPAGFTVLV